MFIIVAAIIDRQHIPIGCGAQSSAVGIDQIFCLHDSVRFAKGYNMAIKQHDAVEMILGLIEIVGGNHHGYIFFFQSIKQIKDAFLGWGIEARQWFIH